MNPEFRQTLQHISRNIEHANEAAQENIYTFTQLYIDPCIGGIKSCFYDASLHCFPGREDQLRRRRGLSRGRADLDFDFYDDWDEEELGVSGVGWGDDELDNLLAGRGTSQPQRQRPMSYGTWRRREEAEPDPTVIPTSSFFGFLESLPFKLGASKTKYKPSGANLEENPGGLRVRDVESAEPLLGSDEERRFEPIHHGGHSRTRSDTAASRSTGTSHSARSDLIMSDEEEDAVPIDEEFATTMLSRRTTGLSSHEDHSQGKGRRSGAPSRISSRTVSSRSVSGQNSQRSSSKKQRRVEDTTFNQRRSDEQDGEESMLAELKSRKEPFQGSEELEILQKEETAQRLTMLGGLDSGRDEIKPEDTANHSRPVITMSLRSPAGREADPGYFTLSSPISSQHETEPFPGIDSPMKSPRSPMSMRDRDRDRDRSSDQPP